ncbi:hypothetical protein PVL29_018454 [Vitis rotundifolia]|uniref:Uncharacterized protein n=1 Tax=Vitis rotundifolia TaxID=103349 RepID=A0AA38Z525_VITRO|nr:hypothetical protein PVL29_018454 [Vitis rotundifolia]
MFKEYFYIYHNFIIDDITYYIVSLLINIDFKRTFKVIILLFISILGPVSISSILTEFLWSCKEAFEVSIRASECTRQPFLVNCLSNLHYGQFYHANLLSFSLHPGLLEVSFQWMYFNQSYAPWGYTNHFASMLPSQNTFQFYSPSFHFEEQANNMNAYVPSLPFCYETASQLSGLAYHFEEKVPRGTGAIILNMCEQDPEHKPRSRMPQTGWQLRGTQSPWLAVCCKNLNRRAEKNSEPTWQVLSPKPEDEGGMVSKSNNQAPSLKPEQERQKMSTQGLLLKPEGEQRKSLTPESTPQGPSAKAPPANQTIYTPIHHTHYQ